MPTGRFLVRLLQGVGWFLLARVGSAGSLLLINVLLARMLTLAEFGVFVLFLSIVTILGTLASVGIGTACTRLVAEARTLGRTGDLRRAAALGFLATLAVAVPVALLVFAWPGPLLLERALGRPMTGLESLCLVVWLVGLALRATGGYVHRGLQNLALAALFQGTAGNLVAAVLMVGVAAAGVVGSVAVPLVVMAVAAAVAALACWVDLVRRLRRLPPDPAGGVWPLRAFLHTGGFMSLATLFLTNGREVCVWVVSIVAGLPEVALFGAAARLVQIIELPVVVMNQALQPFIAEFGVRGGIAAHARSLRVATALVFPVMAGLVLAALVLGEGLLTLVFGPAFAAAQPILVWIMLGRLIQAFFGPSFAVLSMTGHERLLARDAALQFAGLGLLGLLLGWQLGAVGVAVAFCVMLAGFAVYRTVTVQRRLGVWLLPELDLGALREVAAALRRRRAKPGEAAARDVEGAL